MFKALAADPKLQPKVIDYELNIINTSPMNSTGITKSVCIATKALQTMFTLSETKDLINSDQYYYPFLATLVTRLGTAICKKAGYKASIVNPNKKAVLNKKNTKKKVAKKKKGKGGDDEKKEEKKEELRSNKSSFAVFF